MTIRDVRPGSSQGRGGRLRGAWEFYRRSIAADERSSTLQAVVGCVWRIVLLALIGARFVDSSGTGGRVFFGFRY